MEKTDKDIKKANSIPKMIYLTPDLKQWLDEMYPMKASSLIRQLLYKEKNEGRGYEGVGLGVLKAELMRSQPTHLPEPGVGARWLPRFKFDTAVGEYSAVEWVQVRDAIETVEGD